MIKIYQLIASFLDSIIKVKSYIENTRPKLSRLDNDIKVQHKKQMGDCMSKPSERICCQHRCQHIRLPDAQKKSEIISQRAIDNKPIQKPTYSNKQPKQKEIKPFPTKINISIKLIGEEQARQLTISIKLTVRQLKKKVYAQLSQELSPQQFVLLKDEKPLPHDLKLDSLGQINPILTQRKAELSQTQGIQFDQHKEDPISCEIGVAIMNPCGHQISRASMRAFISAELDQKKYQIRCPQLSQNGTSCQELWERDEWKLVAGYTQTQVNAIENQMRQNMLLRYSKKCPYKNHCVTNVGLVTNRVSCPQCPSQPDFCFLCLSQWKEDADGLCGNDICRLKRMLVTKAPLQRTFMMYRKSKPDHKFAVMTPRYRLCPRCKTNVIQNYANSPHMPCLCNDMRMTFCFICLQLFDTKKNRWPCGDVSEYCGRVAPNQTFN